MGSLAIALIIIGVGYFGFFSSKKIESQANIVEVSKNLVINMSEGQNILNNYLSTANTEELGEIKKEMENNDKTINQWIKKLGYGADYKRFNINNSGIVDESKEIIFNDRVSKIVEKIDVLKKESEIIYFELVNVHDEFLELKKEFDLESPNEKEKRHKIQEIIAKENEPVLIRSMGNVLYYSKEALYQYKDEEHIDKWLQSIVKLKKDADFLENNDLNKTLDDYYIIADRLSGLTLSMEKRKSIEEDKKVEYGKYVKEINQKREEMNAIVASLTQDTKTNTVAMLFLMIFFSVFLGLTVAFIITKSITDPIKKLMISAGKIAEGDLASRVEVGGRDEISSFADIFNKMATKLQKSKSEIDGVVKNQSEEIKEKQKFLKDQQKALINVLEDVDEENRKVSKEKDKINTILQSIGDGVFVVDENYKIILFNKEAEEISGFKAREVMGKKYNEVLKFILEDSKKENDYFIKETIKTGKPKNMSNHTALIKKDGFEVPVADSAAPLSGRNGKIIGCVVVFRDVSKERQIDKAKTEFVSLASHQLRTPLSSINWYTEMLLAGDAGKINNDQKDYLKEVYAGSKRMVDLVNSLLNVSRIELGTFAIDPEPIELAKISDSVLKELISLIEKKNLKIVKKYAEGIPVINADPKLARIIFQNLLSNAVKYTPVGGSIFLEIARNNKNILISVRDTGLGIPARQQKNIFTKLFRADNVRESDTEGTGLGLYIVRAIIERSGGKIDFISKENKGTTFNVNLPIEGMKKKEGAKGLSTEGLA